MLLIGFSPLSDAEFLPELVLVTPTEAVLIINVDAYKHSKSTDKCRIQFPTFKFVSNTFKNRLAELCQVLLHAYAFGWSQILNK